jgi:tRNA nucleotidyltransferase/poly(A) polymerase
MDIPAVVRTIIKRLQESGHGAYVVGGAVRDMCLGRAVMDWDVATSASPDLIASLFADTSQFSLWHDTVTLVDSCRHYEVSSYRGSSGPGKSIEEDLEHRDFTINAMAYDVGEEKVLDPCGGKDDLRKKRIRAVNDPRDRFAEDPLRLLRAVRLAMELGFIIEGRTLETLARMSGQLATVARERIRDELIRILMCPKPSKGFHLMVRTGLLRAFLPELLEGYLKRQNAHHRFTIFKHTMLTMDAVPADPILRLTALLHDIAKPRVRKKMNGIFRFWGHEEASAMLAEEIMERLKFSGQMVERVGRLIAHHMIGYDRSWSDGAVRRLIRRVGSGDMETLFCLRKADLLAHGVMDEKLAILSELETRARDVMAKVPALHRTALAIDGGRVMEILDIPEGPEVGKALRILMDEVLEHPEFNTEEGLVGILERMKSR